MLESEIIGGPSQTEEQKKQARPQKRGLDPSANTALTSSPLQLLQREKAGTNLSPDVNTSRVDPAQQNNLSSEVDAQSERKVRQSSSTPRGRGDAKGLNSG
ncbi:hypothetical protein PTTG_30076 [Puccinia triticina 1-1 BBBD Race 1]|uniref:Uncharacterized protein n=1 Tax=Puccinia triticina (isolate 1-1 / race 1 (BBBD)) TaxID=630390 RepID=A0A180G099_PUCT1|nr:hypothetical protein PTTG_30076 [Puccinia triticina 1-1 BBBD Race 1]